MTNPQQAKQAEAFLEMHKAGPVVLLPNVWDAASARIVEEVGYRCLATTSAGVAFAQGFPDGQKIPLERMISVIAVIAAAVSVPVTADVEAGYGQKPEDAARTARHVIDAGAVGMNFEDATGQSRHPLTDLPLQLERIRAIREVAQKAGIKLVLNARTDVYLAQVGDPAKRYDESLRRLAAYRDVGADCVFVPGLSDAETIRRIVVDVKCPVNILAGAGSLAVGELAELGVRRISLGSGPMRATLGLLRQLAREVQSRGTYSLLNGAPPHSEINKLMSANRRLETEN